jgi:riboflavin biosynthesis pyrimidine reductase
MEPLQLLYEVDGLPAVELPPELERLYGDAIGFHEPVLYSNFVSTVDGVVAIPSVPRSNALVADGSEGDRFVMGLLRALADAVLIGAGTLAASPKGTWLPEKVYSPAADAFAELRRRLGRAERPQVAILTGHGSIDPEHPVLASGALVLTSDAGAVKVDGRLPGEATVVTLGADTAIDVSRVVEALRARGHAAILCEAGPHTHGGLLARGLVDDLFLTISPLVAGDRGHMSRYGLAEAADLMPPGARGRLVSVRRHEQHVFLRYSLGSQNSGGQASDGKGFSRALG